jgi:hypothetical protein
MGRSYEIDPFSRRLSRRHDDELRSIHQQVRGFGSVPDAGRKD